MEQDKPNVDEIFLAALERTTTEAKAAYLNEVCRDDRKLRERVERLLNAQPKVACFLEAPAPGIAATIGFPPLAELPGTQIGPYKLLEQIGEGGMGIVYVASQKEPLRRKVALKIIKPGMDTREVVARFEAERQALALMDHPNIAKVFDAGATDAGRPYFAMELVQGTPITEYCDREQLPTRERLALFVTLCHGVQHAHQKGVIHRDLKPSNLLVEVHDVRPVPKIIDFGIAKALGQQLTEKTFHTAQSQMVGTPLYMSPEQASQSCKDVDTRSDIYSLGVLLYELLTGSTPFEKDTLRTAGFDEMRRIIREVEPPRPSARVSTLRAADLSTVCDRRHVEPHKLSQELRGELDWIVMKAMDKDRDRRYATVNDLAADVERYLHDEPVQACPPSVAYRFTKFARRNQAVLVTSALFALMLIVGTGVSVWQAIRATNAEVTAIAERDEKEQQAIRATRAEQAALADRDAKVRAEQQTAKALQTAQERLQFGRQAVDDMYTQFAEKWLAQQAELTQVQKQFLEKALAFYQRLATEESADPEVLFEAATAEQRAGAIQYKLEQHAAAEAAFRRAIELFTQLPREADAPAKYNLELANTRGNLGQLLLFTGRLVESEQEQRLALTLCQALVAQFPDDNQYPLYLAIWHERLGELQFGTGRTGEALENFRQSIALFQPLLTRSPDDRKLKFELIRSQKNLAHVIRLGSPQEAENLYRSVASSAAELVAADPGNPEYRDSQAGKLQSWAEVLLDLQRSPEAEAIYRQAVAIREGLVRDFPQVPRYQLVLAKALGDLGCVLPFPARSEESVQLQRRALEIMKTLVAEYPQVPDYPSYLGGASNNLATQLMGQRNWEEARPLLEQAIVHQKAALAINPKDGTYRTYLSAHLTNLTRVQLALGDPTAAARTAEDYAHHVPTLMDAVIHCENLMATAEAAQRPDFDPQQRESELAAIYLLFQAVIKDVVQRAPDDPDQYMIPDVLTTAPEPLRNPDLALQLARRAVELRPEDGMCQQSLSWALYRSGDYRGSIEAIEKAANGRGSNWSSFFLAMAQWQLGEKTKARAIFDGGSEWLKGYEQRCEEAAKEGNIKYPLPVQLKRLQAEAAAMLGAIPPAVEPAPEEAKVEEATELSKSTPAPEAAKAEEKPQ